MTHQQTSSEVESLRSALVAFTALFRSDAGHGRDLPDAFATRLAAFLLDKDTMGSDHLLSEGLHLGPSFRLAMDSEAVRRAGLRPHSKRCAQLYCFRYDSDDDDKNSSSEEGAEASMMRLNFAVVRAYDNDKHVLDLAEGEERSNTGHWMAGSTVRAAPIDALPPSWFSPMEDLALRPQSCPPKPALFLRQDSGSGSMEGWRDAWRGWLRGGGRRFSVAEAIASGAAMPTVTSATTAAAAAAAATATAPEAAVGVTESSAAAGGAAGGPIGELFPSSAREVVERWFDFKTLHATGRAVLVRPTDGEHLDSPLGGGEDVDQEEKENATVAPGSGSDGAGGTTNNDDSGSSGGARSGRRRGLGLCPEAKRFLRDGHSLLLVKGSPVGVHLPGNNILYVAGAIFSKAPEEKQEPAGREQKQQKQQKQERRQQGQVPGTAPVSPPLPPCRLAALIVAEGASSRVSREHRHDWLQDPYARMLFTNTNTNTNDNDNDNDESTDAATTTTTMGGTRANRNGDEDATNGDGDGDGDDSEESSDSDNVQWFNFDARDVFWYGRGAEWV